jgi:hypothetical protein
MPSSTSYKLSLVCMISTIVPSSFALTTALSAARSVGLLNRDTSVCGGNSNLQQCGNNLPSEFCCGTDSACLPLNNTATPAVVCCPKGQDCKSIVPISCNTALQNATANPTFFLHIQDTTIKLPQCGTACCPLGYECINGQCNMLSSTSASPTSPAPATSATQSATSSSSPTAPSSTSAPSTLPSSSAVPISTSPKESHQGFSGGAFAAGFIPGIVLGLLFAFGLMWFLKRRKAKKTRYSGDFGPVSYNVSDPIYNPIHAARTDFLRRGSEHSAHSVESSQKTSGSAPTSLGFNTAAPPAQLRHKDPNDPFANFSHAYGFQTPTGVQRNDSIQSTPDRYQRSKKHTRNGSSSTSDNPYKTPTRTESRDQPSRGSNRSRHSKRSQLTRSGSTETIDVVMPPPSFVLNVQQPPPALRVPPQPHESLHGRMSTVTSLTQMMDAVGYSPETTAGVRRG